MKNSILAIAVLVVLSLGGIWYFRTQFGGDDKPQVVTLNRARRAFKAHRYSESLSMAKKLLEEQSDSTSALMLAAESATKLEKFEEAIQFYDQVPDSAAGDAAVSRWAAAEVHFHLGHGSVAIEKLNRSIAIDPRLPEPRERIIEMLNTFGRRWETLPHLDALMRSNRLNLENLLMLGNLAKAFDSPAEVARYLDSTPDDLLPTLSSAQSLMREGDFDKAGELLTALLVQQPQLVEAHVQMGLLLENTAPDSLPQWNKQLPPEAESHPNVWYLRGEILSNEHNEESIRCFAEAIRRDPNHLMAHTSIAKQLTKIGQNNRAAEFAEKANKLQRINIALEQIYESKTYLAPIEEVANLTLELGRVWESMSWSGYATSMDSALTWPKEIAAKIRADKRFSMNSPRTMTWANLATKHQWLSDFPIPDFKNASRTASGNTHGDSGSFSDAGIRFENIAAAAGLQFVFNNNVAGRATEGRHIFETTGGGIGVVDYDSDGLPDIFFAQGGDFQQVGEQQPSDQLFRNATHKSEFRFENATGSAGISDEAFGQGVAIGDVNCDGFDDIYVCNIGPNFLWLNNGDGTFSDGQWMLPDTANFDQSWTSSAAIADINFDGLPEIYDANYVTGDDVYTRICTVEGRPRGCSPLVFAPGRDRVLSAGPEGAFRLTQAASAQDLAANSLGLQVFRISGERLPRVFVSVDQQANLFLRLKEDRVEESAFEFENESLLTGLAYDAGGRAQACMGIAAGDVNQDGEVDLFVTNFFREYNTLYLQDSGFFEDATGRSGTQRETMPMLGFGTQFLDAQLDGFQDLLVLNGHIDDHTHMGVAEQMPAQVFSGQPSSRFRIVPADESGDYFREPRLGRALARLDVDADGLTDAVCGDLEVAAALLHNRSTRAGKAVAIRLVGTKSDRNAFCSVATLSSSNYKQTQQLTGGSGYQCSNQRILHFSVPNDLQDLSLFVRWPSGVEERFDGIQADAMYTVVEAAGAYPTGRFQ